jgi:hypothetical protein
VRALLHMTTSPLPGVAAGAVRALAASASALPGGLPACVRGDCWAVLLGVDREQVKVGQKLRPPPRRKAKAPTPAPS